VGPFLRLAIHRPFCSKKGQIWSNTGLGTTHKLPSETPIPTSLHETIEAILDLDVDYNKIIEAVNGMRDENIQASQITLARIMERIFGVVEPVAAGGPVVDLTGDTDGDNTPAGPSNAAGSAAGPSDAIAGPSNAGSSSSAPVPAAGNTITCTWCIREQGTCTANCGHILSSVGCKRDMEK